MSFRSFSRAFSSVSIWLLLSTPAVVSAEVLWRGDFESGDLNQFGTLLNPTKGERKNINVVMTPVHGGTRAAEVVIHPDDLWQGNNHNRVELHYDAVEARTAEGQTTYFSFYFRLEHPAPPARERELLRRERRAPQAQPAQDVLRPAAQRARLRPRAPAKKRRTEAVAPSGTHAPPPGRSRSWR
jgi:hypothetical protein